MYNEYFGFKEAPFSIAPDPRYLYMTAQHRDALAHLVYGLNSEGGCILLTGEVGTGKTTICRCLLEQIPEQANVALVMNPKLNEIELLETICDELKITYPDADNSVKTYTDRIYEFLIKSNRENEKTVLIIDEAQNLDSKVLEQLRLLTNLETDQRKLLQIIILGQPELLDILARKEMRQLAQRITARFHLQPLSSEEVKAYVSHRLAVAGQNIQIFPDNSIKLLYKLSNGVPRLINIICDRALLGAYVENQYNVTPRIIRKASKEVFGELKNVEQQQKNRQLLFPAAAVAGLAILVIATFFYLEQPDATDQTTEIASEPASDAAPTALVSDTTKIGADNNPDEVSDEPQDIDDDAYTTASIDTIDDTVEPAIDDNGADTEFAVRPNSVTTSIDTGDTPSVTASAAKQNYDDIKQILDDKSNDKASAYASLFRAWGKQYNSKTSVTACRQATTFSLSCLHKQGNLNSLKQHNRPAVLSMINSTGEARYLTITSIDSDIASVSSGDRQYTIRLRDLDDHWYGQYTLLWLKPGSYSSAVSPGDSGSFVRWLDKQISIVTGQQQDHISNTYDEPLVAKVKSFQSQQGLIADGIVGPVTIIHINTHAKTDVPSLIALPPSEQG
jgi:general secretion pathway protein A